MPNHPLATVHRLVVVFDICSSTTILEDLLQTNCERYWRDLLVSVKDHLRDRADEDGFELYKFLGDGWILLFDPDHVDESVANVVPVMRQLVNHFNLEYRRLVRDRLQSRPDIEGLTFGLDRGNLIRTKMNRATEYVGRPINVAARLQGAIKDKDDHPQGKALITNSLYVDLKKYLRRFECKQVSRNLRNLATPNPKCWKVDLSKQIGK